MRLPRKEDVKMGIRIGGLYRCCIMTAQARGEGDEGERLTCGYCKKETMVYRDGDWQWVGAGNKEAK
jgi:hypothetical protein